jgi:hypothetical protein
MAESGPVGGEEATGPVDAADRESMAAPVGVAGPVGETPDAPRLVETVAEYLALRVLPTRSGHERFEAILAAHLLMVARREMELGRPLRARERERLADLLGHAGQVDDLEAELAELVRAGDLDPALRARVLAHLRAGARERLAIANPDYLREDV